MMSWLRRIWPFGWTGIAAAVVGVVSFLAATHELGAWPWIDRRPLREALCVQIREPYKPQPGT